MIVNAGPIIGPTDAIRVYLSAPSTTGADGVAAQLVLDAQSAIVPAVDAGLSTGKIEAMHGFTACVIAKVSFDAALVGSTLHAYLYREPVGGGGDQLLVHARETVSIAGTIELGLVSMPLLDAGDRLRIDVQSDGVAGVTINAGDGVTYLEMRAL